VAQREHLERLAVVLPQHDGELWTEVHRGVQEQLAMLEEDARKLSPEIRVAVGSTRGEHFKLFSYRTFSGPNGEVDPVVAGVTFTQAGNAINIEADASGERTGDLISSAQNRTVSISLDEIREAAREMVRELRPSAQAVANALEDPSRRDE
jgi:hypothetical protein